jgi:hypothetical protein
MVGLQYQRRPKGGNSVTEGEQSASGEPAA